MDARAKFCDGAGAPKRSLSAQVAFNPCGHIVSERVARRWAALALPDNAPPNARYRPICPFCAKPLKTDARAGRPAGPTSK